MAELLRKNETVQPSHRKPHKHLRTFSNLAVQLDLSPVLRHDVLYDRKSETCTSCQLGTALIDTVKSFKYALLAVLWNANPGIFHRQHRSAGLCPDRHIYPAADTVVADRVITEVVYKFLYHILASVYDAARAMTGDPYAVIFRIELQHLHARLGNIIQIHVRMRYFRMTAVQLGQAYDVVDQSQKPLRVSVYLTRKTLNFVFSGNPRLDKLRIA